MVGSTGTYKAVGNTALKATNTRPNQWQKPRPRLTLVYDRNAQGHIAKTARGPKVAGSARTYARRHRVNAVSTSLDARMFIRVVVITVIVLCCSTAFECVRSMKVNQALDSARVEEVKAVSGDTLWSIAEHCGGDEIPTEEVVNWIRSHNKLSSAMLTPGQRIDVPVVAQ